MCGIVSNRQTGRLGALFCIGRWAFAVGKLKRAMCTYLALSFYFYYLIFLFKRIYIQIEFAVFNWIFEGV